MTPAPEILLELSHVTKQYGALRPLRVERLVVARGDLVALIGLDQQAAEVFVNLLTGASLPDSGEIRVVGRVTSTIADSAEWFTTLDLFGIVSERAAILEGLSVIQNLAMPFSLDIEPPPAPIRDQAIALAREVGIGDEVLECQVSGLSPLDRNRVRLARALALGPSVVLLEHPSATLAGDAVEQWGREVRRVLEKRGVAALAITMDRTFAAAFAADGLMLDRATGRVSKRRLGRIGFWS